jgi:hypothetical protein
MRFTSQNWSSVSKFQFMVFEYFALLLVEFFLLFFFVSSFGGVGFRGILVLILNPLAWEAESGVKYPIICNQMQPYCDYVIRGV